MSDTPRTDQMAERAPIGLRTNAAFEQSCDLCRELERELNAANDRIKRLEVAGDDLMIWRADPYSVALWRRAKEAKP